VAGEQEARAVALSLIYPPDDPRVHAELRALRRYLGEETAIMAGGQEAETYRRTLDEIDAVIVGDLDRFQDRLEALARS
jgi:hypothetical protein